MSLESVIGWDVGGAHLKAAWLDAQGGVNGVVQLRCPLWRGIEYLQTAVEQVCQPFAAVDAVHALTMTGELVDLFADRAEGVRRIVALMSEMLGAQPLWVYAGRDGFVPPRQAASSTAVVASANWRASTQWAAGELDDGLLLDIGSTTTDIVPFRNGRVEAAGEDDYQRLRCEELLYTGVVRTPVFALAERVPFEGDWLPLMAEHFAVAADVHRLTGQLPEHADQQPSADNEPKSPEHSARRLARMIGRDAASASPAQWSALARYLAEEQITHIVRGCRRVLSRSSLPAQAVIVGAGVGRFLAQPIAQRLGYAYIEFDRTCTVIDGPLRQSVSDCAPAVAVAQLLRGRLASE